MGDIFLDNFCAYIFYKALKLLMKFIYMKEMNLIAPMILAFSQWLRIFKKKLSD